ESRTTRAFGMALPRLPALLPPFGAKRAPMDGRADAAAVAAALRFVSDGMNSEVSHYPGLETEGDRYIANDPAPPLPRGARSSGVASTRVFVPGRESTRPTHWLFGSLTRLSTCVCDRPRLSPRLLLV